ncbi:MAG: FAD-dependent oxidoreductase [Candidatus Eremiobacteraeota bacterium]|nr:FAD-dependent oxidoreductase [Candidatus Eremiobacteraeota bacterium]
MGLADVIVVGAGVIGLSIAESLSRRGAGKVLVVDRGKICSGQTRLSGGLLRQHNADVEEVKLTVESLPFFRENAEQTGFTPLGFFAMGAPDDMDELAREAAAVRAVGVDNQLLDRQQLAGLQPDLSLEGLGGAVYEPRVGYADPVATTRFLGELAQQHGAVIREGITVHSVAVESGKVVGVVSDRGLLEAPRVVMAAGPWIPALVPELNLPIVPRRGQISFFKRPDLQAEPAMWIDYTTGLFSRPHGPEHMLVGLGSWEFEPVEDPDKFRKINDREYINAVTTILSQRLPAVAGQGYVRGYAAIYDVTPDWGCILDRAPGIEGLFLAGGLSGTGFKKAPAIGRVMADLMLEGKEPADSFRLARFARPAVHFARGPRQLPLMPIEPSWVKVGDPIAHAEISTMTPDRMVATGFWSCTEGEFEWHFDYDEMIVVQEGSVTITDLGPGGKTQVLGPGDTATFPAGSSTYWRVTEAMRKYFVIRNPEPMPDQTNLGAVAPQMSVL